MGTPTNPYSSVTISGYNSNPPSDDGTKADSNRVQWSKHISKIGDPVRVLSQGVDSNVLSAFGLIVMTTDAAEEDVIVTMEEFS